MTHMQRWCSFLVCNTGKGTLDWYNGHFQPLLTMTCFYSAPSDPWWPQYWCWEHWHNLSRCLPDIEYSTISPFQFRWPWTKCVCPMPHTHSLSLSLCLSHHLILINSTLITPFLCHTHTHTFSLTISLSLIKYFNTDPHSASSQYVNIFKMKSWIGVNHVIELCELFFVGVVVLPSTEESLAPAREGVWRTLGSSFTQ